jgi:preprotein translocase subunit SecA
MNKQRETIYGLRRQLMEEPDQREYLMGDPPSSGVAYDLLSDITKHYLNPDTAPDDWDVENYKTQIKTIYDFDADSERINFQSLTSPEITDAIWEKLKVKYGEKE